MDKGELIIAPSALNDLEQIWLYIGVNSSPDIADRLLDEVYDRFELLSMAPLMGKERPELAKNVRSMVVEPFVIFYRPLERGVAIARVLRAEQDVEQIAQEGGLE
jgi:toxin ParE1/3/4